MSDNHKKGERRKVYPCNSLEFYEKTKTKMPTYARKRNYNLKLRGRSKLEKLTAKNANKRAKTALRMQIKKEIKMEISLWANTILEKYKTK